MAGKPPPQASEPSLAFVVATRLATVGALVVHGPTPLVTGTATAVLTRAFATLATMLTGPPRGRDVRPIKAIKGDLALLVDLDDLDAHLITDAEHVLNPLDTALGNARDMKEAVLTWKQLDEGPEGLDVYDATGVLLPHLGDLDDGPDALGSVLVRPTGTGDEDGAVLQR